MTKLWAGALAVAMCSIAPLPASAEWQKKMGGDPLDGGRFELFVARSESGKTVLVAACENKKTQFFWQIMSRGEIPLSYDAMPVTFKVGSQGKREEDWAIGNPRQLVWPKDKDKFFTSLGGEKQLAIATPFTETEVFDISGVDAVIKSVKAACGK